MTDISAYQLINRIKKEKKLAAVRKEILGLDSEKALDTILGSDWPVTLVQSFPDQDLYFLMHSIGVNDFMPVLSLASGEQWEYILDVEVWADDRVNLPQMTKTMGALFKADPQRFMRWIVKEKPDLLEYYFFKNMEIIIREHDEDPSSFSKDYTTIDNIFYVRFPKLPDQLLEKKEGPALMKSKQAAEDLITTMLNTVADMDLSVFQALLLETGSIIGSETEEEQFRLKNVRLAEKGYLPYHTAIGIYQGVDRDDLKPRPAHFLKQSPYASNLPMPPQYPSFLMMDQSLFAQALSLIDGDMLLNLQTEFASLVNHLVSADKRLVRQKEDLEKVTQRACCYLSLGLEIIDRDPGGCRPETGAAIIRQYRLSDIFRTASNACMKLKTRARKWHKESWIDQNNLPLSFLDEKWLGLMGGLLLEKPLYYGYSDTGFYYRAFSSLADINETSDELERIIDTDQMVSMIDPDMQSFTRGYLTYKSLILTLWLKNRLGLESSLEPVSTSDFKPFFKELFSGGHPGKIDHIKREDPLLWLSEEYGIGTEKLDTTLGMVLKRLFDELEDEYGIVDPEDIDYRLIHHFFLKA